MESFFTEKRKKILVYIIFLLAIFLITFQFTSTPMVWVDEGMFTEIARNLAFHGVWGLQTAPGQFSLMNTPVLSVSYPLIAPVAISLKLFGPGLFQARLPMIIYMFLLVVFFYLFTKKRYGFLPAVLSVLLLLSFSPFYGNGRPVLGEVPALVFFVLGVWLVLFWEDSNFHSKKWAFYSGLAFGLSCAAKELFLVGVPIVLGVSFIFWFRKIENKKILIRFILGFVPPILIWMYIHLISSHSFLNFIPQFLYYSSNHGSNISTTQTILTNLIRFFTETTPILFLLLLIAIILSFFFRYKNKIVECFSISECIVFSFIILNWVGYLRGTGWYRYFFPANILVYLLFPAAFLFLAVLFKKEIFKKYLVLIPVTLIIFQFYHLVFLSDTSFVTQRTRNESLTSVLSNIDPSKTFIFYNTSEAIIFFKGNNYSQYFYMQNVLSAGDKNIISNPTVDYLLTNKDESINISESCYKKTTVNRYDLFERQDKCKKPN